jgi:hypothetical protein
VKHALLLPAAAMMAAATSPSPVPGGRLSTLELGRYGCEHPDPMDVTRGRPVGGADFSIVNASSYRQDGVMGSYLRTGDDVVMTSGPRRGERYRVAGRAVLVRTDLAGSEPDQRCVTIGSRKR